MSDPVERPPQPMSRRALREARAAQEAREAQQAQAQQAQPPQQAPQQAPPAPAGAPYEPPYRPPYDPAHQPPYPQDGPPPLHQVPPAGDFGPDAWVLGPDDEPDRTGDFPVPPAGGRGATPGRGPGRLAAALGDRVPRSRRGWRLPLAALLLAAWSAACFADVEGLPGVVPVTLATLAPFVSVAAVAIATVALRSRRWVSGGLAVVAGVLPWTFVLGYASADRTPLGEETPRIRVLVVNAHGGQADPAEIVSAVRVHDVDLLVVTELSRTQSNALTDAQLGQILAPQWFDVEDDPEAGLGIWSELDVSDAELLEGTTWPAVRATVQTRTGPLTVVAGHAVPPVPSNTDAWQRDLATFGAAVGGADRTLLVGSFNATPWHAQYRRMLATSGLTDAADVRGRGLRPTWPTWTPLPLVPMDAALVSDDLGVVSADTVAIDGTDHRALLVGLEVP